MAAPLVLIGSILAQGTVHALTKPWPWAFLGLWLVASNFDFGLFAQEARDTIWSLWWVVALIIFGLIVKSTLKVLITERGKTQRLWAEQESRNK